MEVLCPLHKEKLIYFCLHKKCDNDFAGYCNSIQCQKTHQHQGKIKSVFIQTVKDNINKKINPQNKQQKLNDLVSKLHSYCDAVKETINKAITKNEAQIQKILQQKIFGQQLSQSQLRTIKQIHKNQYHKTKTVNLKDIIKYLQSKIIDKSEQFCKHIKNSLQQSHQKLQQNINNLMGSIEFQRLFLKSIKIEQIPKIQRYIQQNTQIHFDSQIISNDQTMLNIFSQASIKVRKAQLIFRASKYNFQATQFHNKCDNIPNTLVIIKPQTNRIFGGFASPAWGTSSYIADKTGKTFLFSYDDKCVFKIMNSGKNWALLGHPASGPRFGYGTCISICNECNKNGTNYARFYQTNKTFQCPESMVHSDNFESVSGKYLANKSQFKIIEYEIFKIEIE